MKKVCRIGTRKSKLAMVQTEIIVDQIRLHHPKLAIKVVPISTKGDQILNKSLASFGGKGVFTKELEEALLKGEIDMAVHSAKDMPMEFPEGLRIGAVLKREDPRDVLVTVTGIAASNLQEGSIIGTSSYRRELQIRNLNPGVRIKVLRGNVQTRLQKLKEGEYDGILLAAAGLKRLGITEGNGFYMEYLDTDQFLPAAGQGILAVEAREGDWEDVLDSIHCPQTADILEAERSFLKTLGGSCNAPAAAYCQEEDGRLFMKSLFIKEGIYQNRAEGDAKAGQGRELGERLAKEVNKGMVYLVGAGPGDPGLLTRKAAAFISRADVIVYDNLVSTAFLNEAKDQAELIYAGKRANCHHLKQEETNELLVAKALEGKMVVRLKGGDPFVFGRGGEEASVLREKGIPFEIVPGVSSIYAVPAYAGIPVTDRRLASSFHVITGHEHSEKAGTSLDYENLARETGTLVFLMGLHNLERITKMLIAYGKDPETPAAVIQQGTTARQKTAVGTLRSLAEETKRQGIETPAITVVGPVVGLRSAIAWYGRKPLFGKRFLITGTRSMTEKLGERLSEYGAEPVPFSLIHTSPIQSDEYQKALQQIGSYQWVVFTSANGVQIFFDSLKEYHCDIRCLAGLKFAVIGDGTKEALKEQGILADYVPEQSSSEDLAKEWIPVLKQQDHVLLLRAREASPVLGEALQAAQIAFDAVALYETQMDDRKAEELNRILPDMDYVIFASASAVRAYSKMKEANTDTAARYLSIGPVTSKAAEKQGITMDQTARHYSVDGILDLLREDFT